jgi:hypothetical protein
VTPIDGPDSAAEHADTSKTTGTPDGPGVGSVAEEAALLVDLLSQRGWSGSSGMPSGAPRSNGGAPRHGTDAPEGHRADASGGDEHRPDEDGAAHGAGPSAGEAGSPPECTCGGTTPAACRVCPVCQLIAFVQQVNPDTIDRVADLVGFAATALRDLATAQRERRGEPEGATPSGPPDAAAADDPERTRPGDPR